MVSGDGGVSMRYTKGDDWVEIKGANDLSMRDLDGMYNYETQEAFAVAKSVIVAWNLRAKGADVPVGDVWGVPLKKWDWLRKCIIEAARDEELDPEV